MKDNIIDFNEIKEIKELMRKTGLPASYAKSMKNWKKNIDQRLADVADDAAKAGISPMEFLNRQSEDENTIIFLESKGFNMDNLEEAKKWVETTDPDNLLLGEGTGNPFDISMGQIRRGMLLKSIDRLMCK